MSLFMVKATFTEQTRAPGSEPLKHQQMGTPGEKERERTKNATRRGETHKVGFHTSFISNVSGSSCVKSRDMNDDSAVEK